MEYFEKETIIYSNCNSIKKIKKNIITEEPLAINIEGAPYSVIMRTPGKETFHGAGFCLAESIIDRQEDIGTIGFCSEMDANSIFITLNPERKKIVAEQLKRKSFVSQTSCGICGKNLIKDLKQELSSIHDNTTITINQINECLDKITQSQTLYQATHATHAAMLFDSNNAPVSFAEDVGRHNALDKAIGEAFLNNELEDTKIAVLSSRISYELVQKAIRAKIPILIGMSNPTALAIELANSLNVTICCVKKSDILVFCGNKRIVSTNN